MENSNGPVHDLSLSAGGAITNTKIVYTCGHRQKYRYFKLWLVQKWSRQSYIVLYFSENIKLHIAGKLSARQMIHMKCQALFTLK